MMGRLLKLKNGIKIVGGAAIYAQQPQELSSCAVRVPLRTSSLRRRYGAIQKQEPCAIKRILEVSSEFK